MCDCIDVKVGSYDNQGIYLRPDFMKINKTNDICLDKCIAKEIKFLWILGIFTTGCCCGHNKQQAHISVIDEDIFKMKILGYEKHHNPCYPDSENYFVSKTIDFKTTLEAK